MPKLKIEYAQWENKWANPRQKNIINQYPKEKIEKNIKRICRKCPDINVKWKNSKLSNQWHLGLCSNSTKKI